jgi:hypothetical protein
MAKAEYPTKAQIARTVEAARAAGIDVASIEVRPDGTIVVADVRTAPAAPQNDFERYQHLL